MADNAKQDLPESELPTRLPFLRAVLVLIGVAASLALISLTGSLKVASAVTVPTGFQESVVFGGLNTPTNVEFADDGRIFVAEKSGIIKVFDSLSDATPALFADLRTNVYNRSDRGLLGLALDPAFPTKPYVYVLYAHDAPIGGTAPFWGSPGLGSDPCPTPPGGTEDGCVASGRLSRLTSGGTGMIGEEKVLVEDWCQQYPAHSMGDLAFGADGALYASAGDGAAWNFFDYGQRGDPLNPCGDPPAGVGGVQSPPTAEGGRLRSQDLRTPDDPTGLNGTIVRLDPETGAAMPDNPLVGSPDPNARRIVGYGLRNPFRFAIRPGTNDVWAGDVGGADTEEIDRIPNPRGEVVRNFGWPCYDAAKRWSVADSLDLNICENLYAQPGANAAPYFSYHRNQPVIESETTCTTDQNSVSGLAFYEGGSYPAAYDKSLLFADYTRGCIWAMLAGTNGLPNKSNITMLVDGASFPVDLEIGPGGDLFYVNIVGGEVRRIRYSDENRPPKAIATASPVQGDPPLQVSFDGRGSSDPDQGDTLSYAWDLDGDGAYDDSTSPQTTWTYTDEGGHTVRLRVTDAQGTSDTTSVVVTVGGAPTATIDRPLSTTTWKVGEEILFSGSARDPEEGQLPAAALSWSLVLQHCIGHETCHAHPVQDFPGVSGGSFVGLDHEYPSYLELTLTARDSSGLTDSETVRLDPRTVQLDFRSEPTGLELVVADQTATTPFSRTFIEGSRNSISAPSPQVLEGRQYDFSSWSDSGPRSHDVTVGSSPSAYTATYKTDTVAPSVQPPAQQLVSSLMLGTTSTATVTTKWTADDDSGVSKYELQRRTNGETYKAVALSSDTATAKNDQLSSNNTYQYRVRASDAAGNWSAWARGPQFVVDVRQEDSAQIGYPNGPWQSEALSSAFGGGVRYASVSGAKATLTFTGSSVAWVAPRDVDRGKAQVWLDGAKIKTIDLYRPTAQPRRMVFVENFATSGTHTLEIRVLGTKNTSSGGTRVDVDGFVILR